jgi:uncharacterized protein YbjT (DUF2867 family)
MNAAAAPILVTGGTGTLGRLVVDRLGEAGREVRVLSRQSHEAEKGVQFVTGDLQTGEGAEAAVEGVEIIVHCAGSSKGDEDKARNLVRAVSQAGAPHLVYISVVGADRIPVVSRIDRAMFGYFASKLAAEQVVAESGLPWTTLRAAQFYDLAPDGRAADGQAAHDPDPTGSAVPADRHRRGRGPARGARPRRPGRPGAGDGRAEVHSGEELLRAYLRSAHRRRRILPVPLPGKAAAALRAGATLAPGQAVGRRTWEEFLADRVSSSRDKAHVGEPRAGSS